MSTEIISTMPKQINNTTEDFVKHIKYALDNLQNSALLGQTSPLAAPYFLGSRLRKVKREQKEIARGQLLQEAIIEAGATIWESPLPQTPEEILHAVNEERQQQGKSKRYIWLLLELRYFRQFFQPPKLKVIWEDYLFVSRPQFHRDLQNAIIVLSQALLRHLHPALRTEQQHLPHNFVTRPLLVKQSLMALQAKQIVCLSGAGGTGKTTLGTAIAQQWTLGTTFHYTIRPTFNDQLNSLLFALGYFLQTLDANTLWQQLVADNGVIKNPDMLIGILRHDLANLTNLPLLCFDEIDTLLKEEPPHPQHAQLIAFWQTIKGLVPMLFIGQKAIPWADKHVTVSNLTEAEALELLTQASITLERPALSHLFTVCHGNPRLLILCKALFQKGEPVLELVRRLRQSVAISTLIPSLQKQLSAQEWTVIQTIAVFRNPIPQDAWPELSEAINSLLIHQLLHETGQGGMILLPALREAIYRYTSIEERETSHHVAAVVRSTRGEYTSSAYHYWKSNRPELAIQIWAPHCEAEIMRGLGSAALTVFQEISLNRLAKRYQQALVLIRSELYKLSGNTQAGLQGLQSVKWRPNELVTAKAFDYWGGFLELQGQSESALEKYDAALHIVEKEWVTQSIFLHIRRGMVHLRQRDMHLAWQETQLARIEAEHMQGIVQEQLGNYSVAKKYYLSALKLAKESQQTSNTAHIHHNLGIMAARQADVDTAISELNYSLDYFNQVGNVLRSNGIYSHLSALYIQVKDYEQAIANGKRAYHFFEQVRHVHYMGSTAANLAEAYFELGQFDEAEKFARQVIALEEAHSVPYALLTMGSLARARGDIAIAEGYFTQSLQMAEENEDVFMVAYAQRAVGEVLVKLGRVAPGREALTTALQLFKKLGIEPEIEPTQALLDKVGSD